MILFDRKFHLKQLERAQKNFYKHNFIHNYISETIEEKLLIFNKKFKNVLVLGYFNCDLKGIAERVIQLINVNEENLPIFNEKFDLIVSNLSLHYVNNIFDVLKNFKCLLNDQGIFIGTFFGGNTLRELRLALQEAELNINNGVSPRVIPLIEINDAARLIQNSGFKNPISDIDTLKIKYSSFQKLLADIRGMGQSNALIARNKNNPGKLFFKEAERIYTEKYSDYNKLIVTYDIITIFGEN